MTLVRVVAVFLAMAAAIFGGAGPAQAVEQPNGSGGCNTANTACYPECAAEWGNAAEVVPKPCPWVHEVGVIGEPTAARPVAVTNFPASQAVAVGNFPASQAVTVANTASERVPVDARCVQSDGSSACVGASGPATDVVLAGSGGAAFSELSTRVEYALGLLVFVAFGYVGWSFGRRRG